MKDENNNTYNINIPLNNVIENLFISVVFGVVIIMFFNWLFFTPSSNIRLENNTKQAFENMIKSDTFNCSDLGTKLYRKLCKTYVVQNYSKPVKINDSDLKDYLQNPKIWGSDDEKSLDYYYTVVMKERVFNNK